MLSAGYTVNNVYLVFAGAAFVGAAAVTLFGVETRRRVLEEVSPDIVREAAATVAVPHSP